MTTQESPSREGGASVWAVDSLTASPNESHSRRRIVGRSGMLAAAIAAMAIPPSDRAVVSAAPGLSMPPRKGATANKYVPHQGKRERARRLRQIAKAEGHSASGPVNDVLK